MSEALDIKSKKLRRARLKASRETGISFQFLADLALKTSAAESSVSTSGLADRMRLPLPLVEVVDADLYREKVVEIRRHARRQQSSLRAARPWLGAIETAAREISGYVGPAPVSLAAYSAMVRAQARPSDTVPPETVAATFSDLVLPEDLLHTLGLAINSRRSLFISGVPGTGQDGHR